jgi:hypothetical protein
MTNNQHQEDEASHEHDVEEIQNLDFDFESVRASIQRDKKFAQRDKKAARARLESFESFSSSFSSSEKDESESSFSEKKSFSSNEKKLNSNVFESTSRSRSIDFRVKKKARYYKKSRRQKTRMIFVSYISHRFLSQFADLNNVQSESFRR